MISVQVAPLGCSDADALIIPVTGQLEPVSSVGRDVLLSAGESVRAKLDEVGELPVGAAIVTPAGALLSDFIIPVVLQTDRDPTTPAVVEQGFLNALRRGGALGLAKIATPPLGTGGGNLDAETAASAMADAWLRLDGSPDHPPALDVMVGSSYEEDVFQRLFAAPSKDTVSP